MSKLGNLLFAAGALLVLAPIFALAVFIMFLAGAILFVAYPPLGIVVIIILIILVVAYVLGKLKGGDDG